MRFLLVDKITTCEPGARIVGIKNVTLSESFLQDHFPGFPVMPGVLQLEAVLQLSSWLAFATSNGTRKVRLVSMKSIKFKEFVVPGDQMCIQVQIMHSDDRGMVCNASVHVGGILKTEIRSLHLSYTPVEELEDPAEALAHFDFISGKKPHGKYRSVSPRSL